MEQCVEKQMHLLIQTAISIEACMGWRKTDISKSALLTSSALL